MLFNFQLKTPNEGLVNITNEVTEAVSESGVNEGICVVFCPHTTAAITINENADPDVKSDFVLGMDKPLLGTWQDVYFCEFDGPRTRKFYVKVMGE